MIRDFVVGVPGSWSDKSILAGCFARHWIRDLGLFESQVIEGVATSYFILGDGIYPHRSSLLVPFKGTKWRPLRPCEKEFNYRHSSARQVVEHTFGILKGRWRILKRPLKYGLAESVEIIFCCAILHNICVRCKQTLRKDEVVPHPRGCRAEGADRRGPLVFPTTKDDMSYARLCRNALMKHLIGVFH